MSNEIILSWSNIWMIGSRLILVIGCYIILALLVHIPRILNPYIIRYPWPIPITTTKTKTKEKKMTVVLAGSYNPPHKGHLAMLLYLSQKYGKVIAVIGTNPKKQYLVTPQQRAQLLQKMLQNVAVSNIQVQVIQGYIWRSAKQQGVSMFFRGIRSWIQDGGEEQQLQILNTWGPLFYGPLTWPIPTYYLEGKPEYNHVSSTLIRQICSNNNSISPELALQQLVPDSIVPDVMQLYTNGTQRKTK